MKEKETYSHSAFERFVAIGRILPRELGSSISFPVKSCFQSISFPFALVQVDDHREGNANMAQTQAIARRVMHPWWLVILRLHHLRLPRPTTLTSMMEASKTNTSCYSSPHGSALSTKQMSDASDSPSASAHMTSQGCSMIRDVPALVFRFPLSYQQRKALNKL
ncbi:hypothetical protein V8G54_001329 [Vigna mungo]|uniref:Uncharacterized protein n=1 Tax=Vigna mungo TaxID=3915 RepID=A0AAQ3P6Y2_VIGMU